MLSSLWADGFWAIETSIGVDWVMSVDKIFVGDNNPDGEAYMRETSPDMPILAITGGGNFAAGDVLRIAELLGADNSLKKPFEPAALLATVRRCLAQ